MKVTRTICSVDELQAISALSGCTFPVASWDKRFMRHLNELPNGEDGLREGLTDKERPQLWRLFIRYRRQINCSRKAELLRLAESLAAPDLRKVAKAQREQAEIDRLKQKYQETMK